MTTVGIPIGVAVIVAAFVLTGIYVRRANAEFDTLTRQIVERTNDHAVSLAQPAAAGAVGTLAIALAAADIDGGERQPLNVEAIVMFLLFVATTLVIT